MSTVAEDLLHHRGRHLLMLFRLIHLLRLVGVDDTSVVGSHEVVGAADRPIDPRQQSRQQQLIAAEQDVVTPRLVFNTRG